MGAGVTASWTSTIPTDRLTQVPHRQSFTCFVRPCCSCASSRSARAPHSRQSGHSNSSTPISRLHCPISIPLPFHHASLVLRPRCQLLLPYHGSLDLPRAEGPPSHRIRATILVARTHATGTLLEVVKW